MSVLSASAYCRSKYSKSTIDVFPLSLHSHSANRYHIEYSDSERGVASYSTLAGMSAPATTNSFRWHSAFLYWLVSRLLLNVHWSESLSLKFATESPPVNLTVVGLLMGCSVFRPLWQAIARKERQMVNNKVDNGECTLVRCADDDFFSLSPPCMA